MKIKNIIWMLLVASLFACFTSFFQSYSICTDTYEKRVESDVRQVLAALQARYVVKGAYPEASDKSVSFSRECIRILHQERFWDGDFEGLTNNWALLDRWGSEISIEICGISVTTNEFLRRFGKFADVVVWSCGPNLKNEFGRGDDIAIWGVASAMISELTESSEPTE